MRYSAKVRQDLKHGGALAGIQRSGYDCDCLGARRVSQYTEARNAEQGRLPGRQRMTVNAERK